MIKYKYIYLLIIVFLFAVASAQGLAVLVNAARGDAAARSVALAAWPMSPIEVHVAASEPFDPGLARMMVGKSITAAARSTGAEGRLSIAIASARLERAGHLLILRTEPHLWNTTYTLKLEGVDRAVAYDLKGVDVAWAPHVKGEPADSPTPHRDWWPTLGIAGVRKFHDAFPEKVAAVTLKSLEQPGSLTLRSLIDCPEGAARVRVTSDVPFQAVMGIGEAVESAAIGDREHRAELTDQSIGDPLELSLTFQTAADRVPTRLEVVRLEGEENRPLAVAAGWLPWSPAAVPDSAEVPAPPFELQGGDPDRGQVVYRGEQARCAVCHGIDGGPMARVGPDLTRLAAQRRSADWIYHQINEPSVRIHPEYITCNLALKNGQVLVGIVRADGPDHLAVADADGKSTRVARSEIEEVRVSPTSVMPSGLTGALGPDAVRDLIAYLLQLKALKN